MRSLMRTLGLALSLGAAFALPAVAAETAAPAAAEQDPGAMMAAMQAAAAPGEHHSFLASLEGDWTYTSTMWMDPTQPPMSSTGTSSKTMLFGGRYLQEEVTGDIMGMTFHGRGTTAFDNTSGEFIGTWIDDLGSGIAIARGQRDGKTITMHGEFVDPMSKQAMRVRQVTRVVDADHHVFEYFMTVPGAPEFKSMEITYTRKGAS